PVDFNLRAQQLEELQQAEVQRSTLLEDLLANWRDGRAKLYVIYKALNFRRSNPELFAHGDYLPVEVRGKHSEHAFAFARRHRGQWCLVAVPRLTARLITRVRAPLGRATWAATALALPRGAPARWENIFSGKSHGPGGRAGIMY